MAELCEPDEEPICDFCAHFFFSIEGRTYKGNGYCLHPDHPHKEVPTEGCDDYKCFRIDGRTETVKEFEEELKQAETRKEKLERLAKKVMEGK